MIELWLEVSSVSIDVESTIATRLEESPSSIFENSESETDNARQKRGVKYFIRMGVYPGYYNIVYLQKGGVFLGPRDLKELKARGEKFSQVSATFLISEAGTGEDYECRMTGEEYECRMTYTGGLPTGIHFDYVLPPDQFTKLLTDIRNGIMPSSIRVVFEESKHVTPTGNGWRWNNDRKTGTDRIKIDWISLRTEVMSGDYDAKAQQIIAPTETALNELIKKQSQQIQTQIEQTRVHLGELYKMVRRYGQILILINFVIAAAIIYWVQQHIK
jgi:hypothetical protein